MKRIKEKIRMLLQNNNVIYSLICTVIVLVILIVPCSQNEEQTKIHLDVEMLISVVIAFFLTTLAEAIARIFTEKFEDITKLTDDYSKLVKMYKANTKMLHLQNDATAVCKRKRKGTLRKGEDPNAYIIPVGNVINLCGRDVQIHYDPESTYTIPEFCQENYEELIGAHRHSTIYNQLTLRVDDVEEAGNRVLFSFSHTTFFNSLVTNRVIDFKVKGICVRDLYAYGPFLPSLKESKLSNHIGANGMVETSDGKLVFVERYKHVSIGKRTMQCSVACSLKAIYALRDGQLTKQNIAWALIKEIEAELDLKKVVEDDAERAALFQKFSFEKNVLFFYQDLVEGGKPQFMFYAKLNITSKELTRRWNKVKKVATPNQDGCKIRFVDKADLDKVYLAPDRMVIRGRTYPAMPSAVGTVALLRQAMAQNLLPQE